MGDNEHEEDSTAAIVTRVHNDRVAIQALQQRIVDDNARLAKIHGKTWGDRSIEDHLVALAPAEGFDITDITDDDRRQIAKVILDAYLIGTAWLTRDDNHGFKREDPLRIEVRDRRVT